jgi:hypothetical protein
MVLRNVQRLRKQQITPIEQHLARKQKRLPRRDMFRHCKKQQLRPGEIASSFR